MILSARFLDGVADVNNFNTRQLLELMAGEPVTIYLQLVDATKDTISQGFPLSGRRYMPATGAVLSVIVDNIDDAKKYTKICSQPFPTTDPSIWSFSLLATDFLGPATQNLRLVLTEGAVTRRGMVKNAFRVEGYNTACP